MALYEDIFHKLVDQIHSVIPQRTPTAAALENCKLVSHRGEHDNKTIFENTVEAFEKVEDAGVWGIELDIRWTKDLIPVVFHDDNLQRLFNNRQQISELKFSDLKKKYPLIPSLTEVVDKFGHKLHLMIEVKQEDYANAEQQIKTLEKIMHSLVPIKDYHFISIYPQMFEDLKFVPTQALLPIAIISYRKKSHLCFKKNYGGILGHYQFISRYGIRKHLKQGRKVGLGFIASKNSLYRELNRGVEWVFTNDALKLQAMLSKS
jgi:glycerophosphoryl diester phosphodiesterase